MGAGSVVVCDRTDCSMSIADRLKLGLSSRLSLVLQTEASECGLACIAMLAQYHGLPTSLVDLRRAHGMSLKGATLKDLTRISGHVGFATRPVRLELDELRDLHTPCILHWDLNHFVVLADADTKMATIFDPAVGIRRMRIDEFSRHFTGVAL